MKEVKKDVYHEARYGRKALMIFSSVLLAISAAILACGIVLLVKGCISNVTSEIAWKVSVGVVLTLLALASGSISLVMLFVSFGMIKTNNGNVKDGNRAIGTINVLKCDKCGREVAENSLYCPSCGTAVEGTIKCECGAVNNLEAEFCSSCGKKLEK